jgi:hypothetical protein
VAASDALAESTPDKATPAPEAARWLGDPTPDTKQISFAQQFMRELVEQGKWTEADYEKAMNVNLPHAPR